MSYTIILPLDTEKEKQKTVTKFIRKLKETLPLFTWKLNRKKEIRGTLVGQKKACYCPITALAYTVKKEKFSLESAYTASRCCGISLGDLLYDIIDAADSSEPVLNTKFRKSLRKKLLKALQLS